VRTIVSQFAVAGLLLGLAACGEDKKDEAKDAGGDATGGTNSESPGNTGSQNMQTDGSVETEQDPDGGEPEAGPQGVPANLVVKSNLTGVTFTQDKDDNEGLRVTSFAYYQNTPNSAGYYTSFFLAIKNFGTKTMCNPSVDFAVLDASSAALFEETAYAESDKYEDTILKGNLIDCLAPGQETIAWTNALPQSGTPDGDIGEVTFDLSASASDAKPVAMPPTVQDMTVIDSFGTGRAGFMGTIKMGADDLESPSIHVYVRDAGGFFNDKAEAITLDSFGAGSTWDFTSTACDRTSPALATDTLAVLDYRFPLNTKSARPASAKALAEAARTERERLSKAP